MTNRDTQQAAVLTVAGLLLAAVGAWGLFGWEGAAIVVGGALTVAGWTSL